MIGVFYKLVNPKPQNPKNIIMFANLSIPIPLSPMVPIFLIFIISSTLTLIDYSIPTLMSLTKGQEVPRLWHGTYMDI